MTKYHYLKVVVTQLRAVKFLLVLNTKQFFKHSRNSFYTYGKIVRPLVKMESTNSDSCNHNQIKHKWKEK